jgi:hypothetical protein
MKHSTEAISVFADLQEAVEQLLPLTDRLLVALRLATDCETKGTSDTPVRVRETLP